MAAKSLILKLTLLTSAVLLFMLVGQGSTPAFDILIGVAMASIVALAIFWAALGRKFFQPSRKIAIRFVVILAGSLIAMAFWVAYALHLNSIELSGAWGCDNGVGVSPKCTGLYGPPGVKNSLIYGSFFLILALIITSISYLVYYFTRSWTRKTPS
jgi:hypothetical protein